MIEGFAVGCLLGLALGIAGTIAFAALAVRYLEYATWRDSL